MRVFNDGPFTGVIIGATVGKVGWNGDDHHDRWRMFGHSVSE
jgi:hypothetical protein